MSEEYKFIQFRVEDHVGIITLNRPDKLNAVSWELAEELSGLLLKLRFRDDVRTILLHGAGRSFCAGGDVDFLSGENDRPMPGTSDASRPIPRSQRKSPGGPFFEVTRQLVLAWPTRWLVIVASVIRRPRWRQFLPTLALRPTAVCHISCHASSAFRMH